MSSLCTSWTAASPRERTASSGCTSLKTEPQATAFDIPAWPSSQMRKASSAVVASPALSRVTASRAAARPSAHRWSSQSAKSSAAGRNNGRRRRTHAVDPCRWHRQEPMRYPFGCRRVPLPSRRALPTTRYPAELRARADQAGVREFTAVDGVDFSVRKGECFGFLGRNGAGKSSTMRMVGCVSPVTSGGSPACSGSTRPMTDRRSGPGWAAARRGTPSTRSSTSTTTSSSMAATSASRRRGPRAGRAARLRPAHRPGEGQGRAPVRQHEATTRRSPGP